MSKTGLSMFGFALRQRRHSDDANPTWQQVEQLNDASKILAGNQSILDERRWRREWRCRGQKSGGGRRDCDSERRQALDIVQRQTSGWRGTLGEFPKRIRPSSFLALIQSRTPPISG